MKHLLSSSILLCLLLFCFSSQAQPTQTITGKILESGSLKPVPDVQILLQQGEVLHQALSDSSGTFQLKVPVGRYVLRTHHLAYHSYIQPDLLVNASRQSALRLLLSSRPKILQEVQVEAKAISPAYIPSASTFTVEETQRTPATYWDPARFVSVIPGVAVVNDQANHLSVRGLAPWAVQWRLQDLPLVNPNHLANGGTLTDRIAYSGGGVNILSGQLLDQSTFWQGYYPAAYGGALGGVFSMNLRPGEIESPGHTLQASFLGLDAATEGPLGSKGASYLANYRYSFTGLLGAMGVDFGGEAISFQDFSFHLQSPIRGGGKISVFGLGGISRNLRTPLPQGEWQGERDALNILYKGRMGAIGSNLAIPLTKGKSLELGLAYSTRSDSREENLTDSTSTTLYIGEDSLQETLWSGRLVLHGSQSRWNWQTGLEANYRMSEGNAEDIVPQNQVYYSGKLAQTSISPFASAQWQPVPRWQLSAGLRANIYTRINSTAILPNLKVQWQASKRLQLWLSGQRSSQLAPAPLYLAGLEDGTVHSTLLPIISNSVNLGQQLQVNRSLTFGAEAFYQHLSQVPVSQNNNSFLP